MKIKIRLSDTNSICNASIDAAIAKVAGIHGSFNKRKIRLLEEKAREEITNELKPWIDVNEFVTIEIDTEAKTCVVIPVKPAAVMLAAASSAAPIVLLTQVELAAKLGITRRTLHTWVQDKVVPMIKVRGFCRFNYPDVMEHLLKGGQK